MNKSLIGTHARLLGPAILGGLSGGALGNYLGDDSSAATLLGAGGGWLAGSAVGYPLAMNHLNRQSKKQHSNPQTKAIDKTELEAHYPELKKTSADKLYGSIKAEPKVIQKETPTYKALFKLLEQDKMFEKKSNDTSFIGRYLASKNLTHSIGVNKQRIMEEIDPDRKMQENQVLLDADSYKQQRAKGYDYMKPTLARQSAGPVWANALLGGVIGGGVGLARGMVRDDSPLGHAALGGGLGAASFAAHRLFNKYENNKVTEEDAQRMKTQQKDRSFISEFVPGLDLYDAYKAGKTKQANAKFKVETSELTDPADIDFDSASFKVNNVKKEHIAKTAPAFLDYLHVNKTDDPKKLDAEATSFTNTRAKALNDLWAKEKQKGFDYSEVGGSDHFVNDMYSHLAGAQPTNEMYLGGKLMMPPDLKSKINSHTVNIMDHTKSTKVLEEMANKKQQAKNWLMRLITFTPSTEKVFSTLSPAEQVKHVAKYTTSKDYVIPGEFSNPKHILSLIHI